MTTLAVRIRLEDKPSETPAPRPAPVRRPPNPTGGYGPAGPPSPYGPASPYGPGGAGPYGPPGAMPGGPGQPAAATVKVLTVVLEQANEKFQDMSVLAGFLKKNAAKLETSNVVFYVAPEVTWQGTSAAWWCSSPPRRPRDGCGSATWR